MQYNARESDAIQSKNYCRHVGGLLCRSSRKVLKLHMFSNYQRSVWNYALTEILAKELTETRILTHYLFPLSTP